MAVYATALPCPGTSMECDIRATVTATARVDGSGWDVAYSLYLYATNTAGFPNKVSGPTGYLDVGGSRRVSYSGGYDFPSGHGVGYTIGLGSGSYFLPVTPTGDVTLAIGYNFTDSGGSLVLGSATGGGSLVAPHIDVSPLRRWSGTAWVAQKLRRWSGSAWVAQKISRWNGSSWVEQK